jgi:hypothetical protein
MIYKPDIEGEKRKCKRQIKDVGLAIHLTLRH